MSTYQLLAFLHWQHFFTYPSWTELHMSASSGPTAKDVISRWLFFAGLLVAAGGALFRIVTRTGRATIALPGFVAAFLGASGLLPHAGTFSTRFGIAYAIATLVSAVGATAAAVAFVEARAAVVAWACGLALLPLPSIAGHALDPGQPRLEVLVDVLHLASAAVWTGGLVQLVFALRGGARADLLRRFSTLFDCIYICRGPSSLEMSCTRHVIIVQFNPFMLNRVT